MKTDNRQWSFCCQALAEEEIFDDEEATHSFYFCSQCKEICDTFPTVQNVHHTIKKKRRGWACGRCDHKLHELKDSFETCYTLTYHPNKKTYSRLQAS